MLASPASAASAKWSRSVRFSSVSFATVRLDGEPVVFLSVSETPWMASLMVLVALVIAMPFTVSWAFWAARVWVRFCVPAGS